MQKVYSIMKSLLWNLFSCTLVQLVMITSYKALINLLNGFFFHLGATYAQLHSLLHKLGTYLASPDS